MGKKGRIVKIAKGSLSIIAKNDINIYAKNINTYAAISINETGGQGVFFGTPEPPPSGMFEEISTNSEQQTLEQQATSDTGIASNDAVIEDINTTDVSRPR
ncbi:hypothetical protein, partial [Aquimarina longa]